CPTRRSSDLYIHAVFNVINKFSISCLLSERLLQRLHLHQISILMIRTMKIQMFHVKHFHSLKKKLTKLEVSLAYIQIIFPKVPIGDLNLYRRKIQFLFSLYFFVS